MSQRNNEQSVSKSQFKPRALEYFRMVEQTGQPLLITDHGRPVLRIVPYQTSSDKEIIARLRHSVVRYVRPTQPVGEGDWEALQ